MQNLDQAKKVIDVLADAGGVFEKMAEDKGSVFSKLSHMASLSGDAIVLAGTDFSEAKKELLSLSDDDKAALMAEFKSKFSLDDKSVEGKIEAGLDLALEGEELGAKLVSFAQKVVAFSQSLKVAAPAGEV